MIRQGSALSKPSIDTENSHSRVQVAVQGSRGDMETRVFKVILHFPNKEDAFFTRLKYFDGKLQNVEGMVYARYPPLMLQRLRVYALGEWITGGNCEIGLNFCCQQKRTGRGSM